MSRGSECLLSRQGGGKYRSGCLHICVHVGCVGVCAYILLCVGVCACILLCVGVCIYTGMYV